MYLLCVCQEYEIMNRLFGKDLTVETNDRLKAWHEGTLRRGASASSRADQVKLLDDNRSKTVAIKIRTLHCTIKDVENAVLRLNFSKMDVDKLQELFQIKANDEELDKIRKAVEDNRKVVLDEPERFLLSLASIPQFDKRIECLTFEKIFRETLFNIDQSLDTLQIAIKELRNNKYVLSTLELILTLGNYMNGGTTRGQADGFDLEVITKLRDVKSMDTSTTLLSYLAYLQTMSEPEAGRSDAVYHMPDAAIFSQASTVSFKEISTELTKLQQQLQSHNRKSDVVALDSSPDILNPFKDKMDDFFEIAKTRLQVQLKKLEETKETYGELLDYFSVEARDEMMPETFFGMWSTFLEDYRSQWKKEQRKIAKVMFEKVDQKRKERMQAYQRRKSTIDSGKQNLKQKFEMMKIKQDYRLSETVRLLRSNSISAIDTVGKTSETRASRESPDFYTNGSTITRPTQLSLVGEPEVGESMLENMRKLHKSFNKVANGPKKTTDKNAKKENIETSHSESKDKFTKTNGVQKIPDKKGQSMIERLKESRRTRLSSDEDTAGQVLEKKIVSSPVDITDRLKRLWANEKDSKTGGKLESETGGKDGPLISDRSSSSSSTAGLGSPTGQPPVGRKLSMKERMETRKREIESKRQTDGQKLTSITRERRSRDSSLDTVHSKINTGLAGSRLRKQASLTAINVPERSSAGSSSIKTAESKVKDSESQRVSISHVRTSVLTRPATLHSRHSASSDYLPTGRTDSHAGGRLTKNAPGMGSTSSIGPEVKETRASRLRQQLDRGSQSNVNTPATTSVNTVKSMRAQSTDKIYSEVGQGSRRNSLTGLDTPSDKATSHASRRRRPSSQKMDYLSPTASSQSKTVAQHARAGNTSCA